MKECLFCKIIKKEVDSNIVYEDESCIVIMDKFPDSPGHVLIIPKKHIIDLMDMNKNICIHLNEIVKNMVSLVMNKLQPDGISVIVNYGSTQMIKHYHIHIIPKYDKKLNLSNEEVYNKLIEK